MGRIIQKQTLWLVLLWQGYTSPKKKYILMDVGRRSWFSINWTYVK